MDIKKGLELRTSDFWYDLTDGGYLDPWDICVHDSDAQRVEDAVEVIMDFYRSCEKNIPGFIQ